MTVRKTGFLVAVTRAGGIAAGAASSTIAADPALWPSLAGSPWQPMSDRMGGPGAGMIPGSAAGRMGSLGRADRDALLAQCDELHDAMHAGAGGSLALPRR